MEEIKIFIFQNNLDFIKHWIPFPHNVKLPTLKITDKFLFILPNVHLIITLVHVLTSLCKKSWVNELHTGKLFFLMNGYKPLKYTTIIHQWQKKKCKKHVYKIHHRPEMAYLKKFSRLYSSETDGQVSKIVLLVEEF